MTPFPTGLVLHLAVERAEGGLRYIDVWDTQADWERFVEQRLHPVVHGLLSEVFGDDLPPEPEQTLLPVVHAWSAVTGSTRERVGSPSVPRSRYASPVIVEKTPRRLARNALGSAFFAAEVASSRAVA